MNEQKVERISFTRRFLDRMKNPPEYVDEELPTKTVHIFNRKGQGRLVDGGIGSAVNMGSIEFSGSHYDFGPGSYSLRITRRSVYIGSVMSGRNTELDWFLHHSRVGTVDMIPFFIGTQPASRRAGDWKSEALGGPMNPVYALGPGTIQSAIYSRRGTARVSASLEGIIG